MGYGADVLVVDPDAGLCLAQPLRAANIGIGRHQAHTPAVWVAAVARLTGVATVYLRSELDADGVPLRVECAAAGAGKVRNTMLRWTEWDPEPPLDRRSSWERPDWMARATAHIDRVVSDAGGQRTALPVQIRHNAMVALLKAETTRGPVWLKEVAQPFSREARAIGAVGRLCRSSVPKLFANDADWFILDSFPVEGNARPTDPYGALADIQIACARGIGEFTDWPRRRLSALAQQCRGTIDAHPAIDAQAAERLEASLDGLNACAARAAETGLPDTVVHGDFHADNRHWTGRRWILYDWSDSVIGYPFLDLGLAYNLETPDRLHAGLHAYADRWKRALPPVDITSALATAPALSCAHQLLAYAAIARAIPSLHAWSHRQMSLWSERIAQAVGGAARLI